MLVVPPAAEGSEVRADIEEALALHRRKTRKRITSWHGALEEIEVELSPDEVVVSIVDGGTNEHGLGIVVLTQARLLLWETNRGLSFFNEVWLHDITTAEFAEQYGRDYLVVHGREVGQVEIKLGNINVYGWPPSPGVYTHFAACLNELSRQAMPPEPPSPQPAVSISPAEEIAKLAELMNQGLLSPAEFEQGKRKALGEGSYS
jgi:hypothetical protein